MSESLVFDTKRKQIKRMFAEVSHSQETASHTDLLTFAQAVRICPVCIRQDFLSTAAFSHLMNIVLGPHSFSYPFFEKMLKTLSRLCFPQSRLPLDRLLAYILIKAHGDPGKRNRLKVRRTESLTSAESLHRRIQSRNVRIEEEASATQLNKSAERSRSLVSPDNQQVPPRPPGLLPYFSASVSQRSLGTPMSRGIKEMKKNSSDFTLQFHSINSRTVEESPALLQSLRTAVERFQRAFEVSKSASKSLCRLENALKSINRAALSHKRNVNSIQKIRMKIAIARWRLLCRTNYILPFS